MLVLDTKIPFFFSCVRDRLVLTTKPFCVAIALPHCEQHEKMSFTAGFAFPNHAAATADFTKNLLFVILMVRLPIHLKVLN